jgi:hypothetical protein
MFDPAFDGHIPDSVRTAQAHAQQRDDIIQGLMNDYSACLKGMNAEIARIYSAGINQMNAIRSALAVEGFDVDSLDEPMEMPGQRPSEVRRGFVAPAGNGRTKAKQKAKKKASQPAPEAGAKGRKGKTDGNKSLIVLSLVRRIAPTKNKAVLAKVLSDAAEKQGLSSSDVSQSLQGLRGRMKGKKRVGKARVQYIKSADGNPRGGRYFALPTDDWKPGSKAA